MELALLVLDGDPTSDPSDLFCAIPKAQQG